MLSRSWVYIPMLVLKWCLITCRYTERILQFFLILPVAQACGSTRLQQQNHQLGKEGLLKPLLPASVRHMKSQLGGV